MVQTIPAKEITLEQLEKQFRLQLSEDERFFWEWQEDLPELTDWQSQLLDEVKAGLPQLLAYMLGNPHPEKPSFGMITNGGSFIFIKLVKGERSRYATSDLFGIGNRKNNLCDVLRILKKLITTTES